MAIQQTRAPPHTHHILVATIQTINDCIPQAVEVQDPPDSPLPHHQLPHHPRQTTRKRSNTAPIPMLIVDKIVEEDRHMRPRFIQLRHFHKTFALEMIESVLTNYHQPTLPQAFRALILITTRLPNSYFGGVYL
ncbi:hypothetical protein BGY98DRAFT_1103198 [Russula aff. rugulosa BPL654]|nr:hypothetical protein BGY98DRAFT_1103198 [Russula aff. rugulosa BPL654]